MEVKYLLKYPLINIIAFKDVQLIKKKNLCDA